MPERALYTILTVVMNVTGGDEVSALLEEFARRLDLSNVTLSSTGVLALPSPVLTTPQINDTSADHQYVVAVNELAADRTITLPLLTAADIFVFEAFIQTLTNKTLALGSNTITGTTAEFNTALTDNDFATLAGIETLTNKTIALGSNTVTGTMAQFNTAVTDDNLAARAAANTFTAAGNNFDELLAVDKGLSFPATQVASSGANDLDDYEEGTWTPTLTFATPGNLNVVHDDRVGSYAKVGQLVIATFTLSTSTFTHTTASGAWQVTGFPFTSNSFQGIGALEFSGITKATYTNFISRISGTETLVDFIAGGSGVARSAVIAADMPTGGTIRLVSTMVYRASA